METLLKKVRPDDVLGNLPEHQQDQIMDWCETETFRDVLKKIEAPVPEGFGLKVQYNSLRKFFLKKLPFRAAHEREDDLQYWNHLIKSVESAPVPLAEVLLETIQKQVFRRLAEMDLPNEAFFRLAKVYERCLSLDLAQKKLQFQNRVKGFEPRPGEDENDFEWITPPPSSQSSVKLDPPAPPNQPSGSRKP